MNEMAAEKTSSNDMTDDDIREKVRGQVRSNDKTTLSSLKDRYKENGVPSITMGQVRQLIRDSLSTLQNENTELNKQLQAEREKASAAAIQQDAMRELEKYKTKVLHLETELTRITAEAASDKEQLEAQIKFLEQKVASLDIGDAEEQRRKIAELQDLLKAARDALAEAEKEIRRLLSELRYAEPFITPDHSKVSAATSKAKEASSSGKLADKGQQSVTKVLAYVRANEEMCRVELPQLVERMNNLEAPFPAVARMIRLSTLHQENRRWLGVLNDVLDN
ncbi:MAG: DNA repair exonuclease SbcCD ATPase subunit [Pseudohongiellaceae bacterium]|jgi:DNA repair exonuclease SbcCD ATPase subunit